MEIQVRPEVPVELVWAGFQGLLGPQVLRGIPGRPVFPDLGDSTERRVWRGMLESPDLQETLAGTELPAQPVLRVQLGVQDHWVLWAMSEYPVYWGTLAFKDQRGRMGPAALPEPPVRREPMVRPERLVL